MPYFSYTIHASRHRIAAKASVVRPPKKLRELCNSLCSHPEAVGLAILAWRRLAAWAIEATDTLPMQLFAYFDLYPLHSEKFLSQVRDSVDPFYSQANLDHLRQVREDADAGCNMSTHDLIEE
jgi:hypothetical protein